MTTIVSQEALPRVLTAAIVADVPDRALADQADRARTSPSAADAEVAIARLRAMSPDLRGCVILDPEGEALGASHDLARWAEAGRALLAAADAAAAEPVTQAHVGTEDGEAFVLRDRGYALIAAAERFALTSLLFFDIRVVLSDLVDA